MNCNILNVHDFCLKGCKVKQYNKKFAKENWSNWKRVERNQSSISWLTRRQYWISAKFAKGMCDCLKHLVLLRNFISELLNHILYFSFQWHPNLCFKEIAEKTKTLESLEEEKTKFLDKLHQYKERMIDMKNTIDEFQKANSELQKRLDEEVKQKNGM